MGTMEEILGQVRTLGLSEGTVERILYGNARELLTRLGLA
jgi:hypothetical protein